MRELAIVEAPSVLGLRPSGVQDLPSALIEAGPSGLLGHPGAVRAGRVEAPPYDPRRDAATGVLNPAGIARYSVGLADAVGAATAARRAVGHLTRGRGVGYWVHLGVDVLDDAIMPAVDYRLPGGLTWSELEGVLRTALADERAVGFDVTIFNPRLDPGGSIAARLTECLRRGLSARTDHSG